MFICLVIKYWAFISNLTPCASFALDDLFTLMWSKMQNYGSHVLLQAQSFSTKYFVVFVKLKKSSNEAKP